MQAGRLYIMLHIFTIYMQLNKYYFSWQNFYIWPRIRNKIKLLKKSEIGKALKKEKICEIDGKTKFKCRVKRSHYFRRNPNPFSLDYIVFLLYLPKIFLRKYMLLVIDYISFATCPTLLTQCLTIFVSILKIWSNIYVCKISPKYLFYIYFILFYISRGK